MLGVYGNLWPCGWTGPQVTPQKFGKSRKETAANFGFYLSFAKTTFCS